MTGDEVAALIIAHASAVAAVFNIYCTVRRLRRARVGRSDQARYDLATSTVGLLVFSGLAVIFALLANGVIK